MSGNKKKYVEKFEEIVRKEDFDGIGSVLGRFDSLKLAIDALVDKTGDFTPKVFAIASHSANNAF